MSENKAIDKANLELALSENNKKILEYTDTADAALRQDLNVVSKYQKYLNTELDYAHFSLPTQTGSEGNFYDITQDVSNGIEYTTNSFYLKKGKTYSITASTVLNKDIKTNSASQYRLYNKTAGTNIGPLGISISVSWENTRWNNCDINYIYSPAEDCEIALQEIESYNPSIIDGYITVQEIGRQITIDPVEHINTTQGIEDAPVGHIISHMGNNAPAHYLICDGTEYTIEEYPDLAQHFINEFGSVNYFGGDGTTTFAVPDLRGEFLRGSGTATRDTGSGADVGEHQDGTQHINFRLGSGTGHPVVSSNSTLNITNKDKSIGQTSGERFGSNGSSTSNTTDDYYTSRPTNTSVLYCIKYEPTYYMNVTQEINTDPELQQIISQLELILDDINGEVV